MIKSDSNINGYLKIMIIILITIGVLIYPITKFSQYMSWEQKEKAKYCDLLNGTTTTLLWEVNCNINWRTIAGYTGLLKTKYELKEYCNNKKWKLINLEYGEQLSTDEIFYCELNWKKLSEIPK